MRATALFAAFSFALGISYILSTRKKCRSKKCFEKGLWGDRLVSTHQCFETFHFCKHL
ncbi:MAG: hypothetical protein GF411_00825 [Candidatus Lokiarchaeota archaeon]|nr:hypothetical protein [Candidatus Lokiarchaeota archaeon]